MITAVPAPTAQQVADVANAHAAFLHGLVGIAQGHVPIVGPQGPLTIGLGLSPALQLAGLPPAGNPPKIQLGIDPILAAAIQAPGGAFNTSAIALALCGMVGFAYELLMECDDCRPPAASPHCAPTLEFLRHIRNAAFHGNSFDIRANSPVANALWRGRNVDRARDNGRALFFNFLAPGDAFLLLDDVLRVVQPGVANPVTIM